MWRTFDVGAVVESLPFSDAVVAAGAGGMARRVSRARLAATPEHLRRVGANELVVTTAETLLATGEAWEHILARLDAAHIAAVAVRLDPSERLPAEMLATSDRLSLPVITRQPIPGSASRSSSAWPSSATSASHSALSAWGRSSVIRPTRPRFSTRRLRYSILEGSGVWRPLLGGHGEAHGQLLIVAEEVELQGLALAHEAVGPLRRPAKLGQRLAVEVEHELTTDQRKIYNDLAGAWQLVLNRMDEALKVIGAVEEDPSTGQDVTSICLLVGVFSILI